MKFISDQISYRIEAGIEESGAFDGSREDHRMEQELVLVWSRDEDDAMRR